MTIQTPQNRKRPEAAIQRAIIQALTLRGWYVKSTHGNMYQSGFPDLYATHSYFGARWIEVKLPDMRGSKFTPAQRECFPKFLAFGTGIWILTSATDDELQKLMRPSNAGLYLL